MSDYKNPLWPNGLQKDDEGYTVFYPLGTNKVDITTITWPDGDKLVSPFVYQNGKLVGFVDTKALTVSGSAATTMNYSHIEADFSSISEGTLTVDAPNATVKKFRWSVVESGDDNVIVTIKYKGCKTVDDVKAVDPNYLTNDIVDGVWSEGLGDLEEGYYSKFGDLEWGDMGLGQSGMFDHCELLTTFSSDLSSLTNGSYMFYYCGNLTTFSSDLPNLTNGSYMFQRCDHLSSFTSDLSSLILGQEMFDWCTNLTTFSSNLSSLKYGNYMFEWCKNLTAFTADLFSLENGYHMFYNCKLDAPSVKNIIDTINTYAGSLALGIGCNNTAEDKDLFAQEVGYTDMASILAVLQAKGWDVSAQYTGRPTTTYSLRKPSEDILPVFVKLVETEDHADYTSMDDSKKFRLDWFHETTGSTEGYTQFVSLEEAVEHFNIKPIERN